jgi:2-amino-4-hydroxy-6-hydroxymethyldihydropteridine diphosphokinase
MEENTILNIHTVYLALGSNLGDKKENIKKALENISFRLGRAVSVSSLYQTQPEGFESDNDFINAACRVETKLSPLEVLENCQVIEREMGRKSKSVNGSYSDRIIDIDLLMFDDEVLEYPHLVVPHPHMHKRMFVLAPLAEIAPDKIHPLLKKTINELKNNLNNE